MAEIITPANLQDLKDRIQLNSTKISSLLTLFNSAHDISIQNYSATGTRRNGPLLFEAGTAEWQSIVGHIQRMAEHFISENLRLHELIQAIELAHLT